MSKTKIPKELGVIYKHKGKQYVRIRDAKKVHIIPVDLWDTKIKALEPIAKP